MSVKVKFKNLVDNIKRLSFVTTERVGKKGGRTVKIASAACIGNAFVGLGKGRQRGRE